MLCTQVEVFFFFDVLLTVHLSIFISVINQHDAQNFCFTTSLFHASTCFEHLCSSSGGQNCITQPLVKFCASSWLITETNNNDLLCFTEISLYIYICQATSKYFSTSGNLLIK